MLMEIYILKEKAKARNFKLSASPGAKYDSTLRN